MPRTKYALVGTGIRAIPYYGAIASQFQEYAELVAFCDLNQTRMNYANKLLVEEYGHQPVPTYKSGEFEQMIAREKPDVVIVTTIDRTHHTYLIRAMELGCDAITEKPMTIDEEKCQAIMDTVERTGRQLRVTFNYRYVPVNTKVRELLMDGVIGDVYSVHFEWLLNKKHGADYFRRWHRDKRNSGGLLVHKSTHHFDLVNFWLGSRPKSVYALGDLRFYGRANAEERGVETFYQRAHGSEAAKQDPFALHLERNGRLKAMYLEAEHEDGYQRDQSAFGDGISIEDTLGVMVQYENRAILTYSLTAYMPKSTFHVAFNGSKGRLEIKDRDGTTAGMGGIGGKPDESSLTGKRIVVHPMFGDPYEVPVEDGEGGHGGGDQALMRDLFAPQTAGDDRFDRAATHLDGAYSILTGIAGNRSLRTGQAVQVNELVRMPSITRA